MKLIVASVLALLVAAALAAPAAPAGEPVPIVRSSFDQSPEGGFSSSFETGDGTKQEQTGEVKQSVDEDNKPISFIVLRGSYSYVDPEGKTHNVVYTADENGFHPESDDLPKTA